MQLTLTTILTILSSANAAAITNPNANPISRRDNQALVAAYSTNNCIGDVTLGLHAGSANQVVSCTETLGNSASVSGSGCRTYFFTDAQCTDNYFGAGNAVPDSSCYLGIAGVTIVCAE